MNMPLIVIAGPTASGKTGLSIRLARAFNGEIICADSRTIYKDMDIGTAKPSLEEQAGVPHWGLDIATPGELFTAADFKRYAEQKIADIRRRGKVPFLVGGTGLYIDAVVLDYQFSVQPSEGLRTELLQKDVNELQEYCVKHNIKLPENHMNKRYLVRAIEQNGINQQRRKAPVDNTIVVGISTDRDVLRTRIRDRAEQFFEQGALEEAIALSEKYGWHSEAMTGNIYRLAHQYVDGELTIDEVKQKFITADWRLAKRQLTWLRRNDFVQWLQLPDAENYLQDYLANCVR